mmetsp:Transcript_16965/g.26061  ORF Transcript_16965/g.26061 Transcript_16965/m.26061 type:complete len:815 (+) Transcript_16965:37-2481(+)
MNSSNNNPSSSSSRPQGAGFRSGPIRNVGGGPPSLSSGLAVNRAAGPQRSSTARTTAPMVGPAAPPVPSAPRHSYDTKPVQQQQQSYDPFSQQRNVSYNNNSMNTSSVAPSSTLTPDNSAQLQPHIVSLPPSPSRQQQQQVAAAPPALQHPLQPSSLPPQQQQNNAAQQQQQGLYQARSSDHNPAAELQKRFYPQHYNNQQQQQAVVPSQPITQQQQQPNLTSYQVKPTPTIITTQQQQQQQVLSTVYSQPQQPPPIQRNIQPLQSSQPTPDEDLDNFLSTGITDSASGMSYTRPKPLPPNTGGVLSKSKLLASRRAWGDVIRVTNDALIVRNMDGGGGSDVGKHHSFYSEIVACAATNSSSGSVGGGGPNSPTKVSSLASSSLTQASSPNEIDELQKLRRETCELIVLRFIAHLKLRRYVDLGKEVNMLGLLPFLPDRRVDGPADQDDVVNNNDLLDGPLSWKEGSIHSTEPKDKLPPWIPYGLRILAAQQLQYNDGSSKALDVLLDMRDRTVRTEYWNTGGMEVWKSTLDNAIVNACIRMKEWRLALHYVEELIGGLEEGVKREVLWWCRQDSVVGSIGEETRSQLRELITSAAYVELLSRQILILLQSGAIKAAETVQGDVRLHAAKVEGIVLTGALSRIHGEFALIRQVPVRQIVNDGLILFAQSDYELAAQRFRNAMELQQSVSADINDDSSTLNNKDDPSSPGYPSWKDLDSPTLGFDADPSLTVECINNLSLCLLYSGQMRAAVHEMESLIRKDPCEHLTEGMAFNLCTLYELGSDGEECTKRKKRLQRVAKRFFLHDIGVESFRLN